MNPYKIEGPAFVQVSGGRTSGFMFRQILDAHNGKLPDDVIPTFCNTGIEHESCYQFLREMSQRWHPITFLEYRLGDDGKHAFHVTDYCGAARDGKPFSELIKKKGVLPNPITRYCTSELKIRTIHRYAASLGWDEWTTVVGLRADEPWRVHKLKGDRKAEEMYCPMYQAGHTREDVMTFWSKQDFDLLLPGNDDSFGNCVGCFLKGKHKIEKVGRSNPENLEWWAKQEERTDLEAKGQGRVFRIDRPSYREILTQLTVQGQLFDDRIEDDTLPCMCTD